MQKYAFKGYYRLNCLVLGYEKSEQIDAGDNPHYQ